MTYIDLINQFWKLNKENIFSATETQLYFKLLDTCNSLNWKNPFTHSNGYICGELGISEKTLRTARQQLVNYGLIELKSVMLKRQMTEYTIKTLPIANNRSNQQPGQVNQEPDPAVGNPGSQNEAQTGSQNDPPAGTPAGTPTGTPAGAENPDILRVTKEIDKEKRRKKRESKDSLSAYADLQDSVQEIFDQFNVICKNVLAVKVLTKNRKEFIGARLREYGREAVLEVLHNAGRSDFLGGSNSRKWMATIDWMFKPNNFVKVLEGQYNNRPTRFSIENYNARPSNLEIIEETYNNLMADENFNTSR